MINGFEAEDSIEGGFSEVTICTVGEEYSSIFSNQRRVAVKAPKERFLQDQEHINLFLKEAHIWAATPRNKNVVTAYSAHHTTRPFVILEFCKGTLLEHVTSSGWSVPEAIDFFNQTLDGLLWLSENIEGFVHQDIKPNNLLLGTDEYLKVSDFGLSSLEKPANSSEEGSVSDFLKDSNAIAPTGGTALFMAPEVLNSISSGVSQRSDVFSLGATFTFLIQLHTPSFDNKNEIELGKLLETFRMVLGLCTSRDYKERPSDYKALYNLFVKSGLKQDKPLAFDKNCGPQKFEITNELQSVFNLRDVTALKGKLLMYQDYLDDFDLDFWSIRVTGLEGGFNNATLDAAKRVYASASSVAQRNTSQALLAETAFNFLLRRLPDPAQELFELISYENVLASSLYHALAGGLHAYAGNRDAFENQFLRCFNIGMRPDYTMLYAQLLFEKFDDIETAIRFLWVESFQREGDMRVVKLRAGVCANWVKNGAILKSLEPQTKALLLNMFVSDSKRMGFEY